MKRLFLYSVVAILAIGCTRELSEDFPKGDVILNSFKATIEKPLNAETKAHLEGLSVVWDNGDRVMVLEKTTYGRTYTYSSETGDFSTSEMGFDELPEFMKEVYYSLPYYVAISPSSAHRGYDMSEDVNLPAVQQYKAGSFCNDSHIMYAETDDMSNGFEFKNMCGYLCLYLYGDDVTVKSIVFTANGEHNYVSGDGYIDGNGEYFRMYGWIDSVAPRENSSHSVTLDCGEAGVRLGTSAEDATAFYIALPPQTFEGGFSITVTDSNDQTFTKSAYTGSSLELLRNHIKPMAPLKVQTVGELNKIYYSSTQKLKIQENYYTSYYGSELISHEFNDGQGILIFEKPVEKIPYEFCQNDGNVSEIILPQLCKSAGNYAFNNCSSLQRLVIKAREFQYGFGAGIFANCNALARITVPFGTGKIQKEAVKIDNEAIYAELVEEAAPASNEIWYIADSKTNLRYSNWGGCTLKEHTYYQSTGEGFMKFDSDLTSIGYKTFMNSSAEIIYLPDSVTEIGESTFEDCNSLKQIIMRSVRKFGKYAMKDNSSLESITFPATLVSLGQESMAYHSALKTVTFEGTTPPTLDTQYGGVFAGSKALTDIYVPADALATYQFYQQNKTQGWGQIEYSRIKAIETIQENSYSINGNKITIHAQEGKLLGILESIDDMTSDVTELEIVGTLGSEDFVITTDFIGSYTDKSTALGNWLRTIGASISSLDMTNVRGLTEIPAEAFIFCCNASNLGKSSLADVKLPKNITNIGENSFLWVYLTSITWPENLETISDSAFYGSNFSTLSFPQGLKSVGRTVLYSNYNLKTVVIPSSVTSIGSYAIYNSYDFKIVFEGTSLDYLKNDIFYSQSYEIKVFLPQVTDRAMAAAIYEKFTFIDYHYTPEGEPDTYIYPTVYYGWSGSMDYQTATESQKTDSANYSGTIE